MKIYNYDENGFFVNESEARQDPRNEQRFVVPANATEIKPTQKKGFIAQFDGEKWTLIKDNRGLIYYDENGTKQEIKTLTDELPENHSLEPRPSAYHTLENGKWALDESKLEDAKHDKRLEINQSRTQAELSGFEFNDKLFDSDRDSISRIGNAATAAQSALLTKQEFQVNWVTKDNDVMTLDAMGVLKMHGAMTQNVNAINQKAQELKKQIEEAQTIEAVLSIGWNE